MMKVVQKGKSSTVDELLGDKAYGRLMNTLDIANDPRNTPNLRWAYDRMIKSTTGDTALLKVPFWTRLKEYAKNPVRTTMHGGVRGVAQSGGDGTGTYKSSRA